MRCVFTAGEGVSVFPRRALHIHGDVMRLSELGIGGVVSVKAAIEKPFRDYLQCFFPLHLPRLFAVGTHICPIRLNKRVIHIADVDTHIYLNMSQFDGFPHRGVKCQSHRDTSAVAC